MIFVTRPEDTPRAKTCNGIVHADAGAIILVNTWQRRLGAFPVPVTVSG